MNRGKHRLGLPAILSRWKPNRVTLKHRDRSTRPLIGRHPQYYYFINYSVLEFKIMRTTLQNWKKCLYSGDRSTVDCLRRFLRSLHRWWATLEEFTWLLCFVVLCYLLCHILRPVQLTQLSLITVGTHGKIVWFHGLSASLPSKKIASVYFKLRTLLDNKLK
jgi:hypothetical protein